MNNDTVWSVHHIELLYVFERLGMQHTSYMDNFYNISMVHFLSLKVSVSYQWNLIFKKLSVLKVVLCSTEVSHIGLVLWEDE